MRLMNRIHTAGSLVCLVTLAFGTATTAGAMRPAFVLFPALAMTGTQSAQDKPNTSQPDQPATASVIVTGTIVKSGSNLVLRDSFGAVYQLDAQDKAAPFEGKSVKVTGKLEAEAKLLHVESIEELNA